MTERINRRIAEELAKKLRISESKMRLSGYADYLPNGDAKSSALFVLKDEGDHELFVPDDRFDFLCCHVRKGGRKVDGFGMFEHEIDLLVIAATDTVGCVLRAFAKENEYHEKSYISDTQSVVRNYLRYVTDNPELSAYVIKYTITTDESIFGEGEGNDCATC